ncbi:DUF317 domain-containing protein [Streptomyces sp. EMB24]|uniref:DUF317 domain-containing protein n=1 Tax=Streptomyces sp. EMB24 TaxID=2835531 RepID=UPI00227D641C|nr:DUF317 domain-containing protein [Streptomyces sp. EMB24]
MPTYWCRENRRSTKGSSNLSTSATLLPAVVRPAANDHHWLSSDHCAGPVLDLLCALGWAIVDTPAANVHAASLDGRVYVGWLPEDPAAWKRDIVWHVQVWLDTERSEAPGTKRGA